jgi:hypothetical protein
MITLPIDLTPEEYYSRNEGLVSSHFHNQRVLIVGTGGGSYQAEKLARMGPAKLTLVDRDAVEVANLARTSFTVFDVGRPKAVALADHIQYVNPFVCVEPIVTDICEMDEDVLLRLVSEVDLIVAGTDHFPAQKLLNRLSQQASVPAVFIGIHADAFGGRVIWSLPGRTPCYRCVAHDRYLWFEQEGEAATDLPGARGLVVDIQCIDMVALKVAVALLERGQNSAMGRFFNQMQGRNEIIVRTTPDYEYGGILWDAILSDLPTEPKPFALELQQEAFFAMDTLWLKTEYLAGCPDCLCRGKMEESQ